MKTIIPYPILRIAVDAADNSSFLRATQGTLRKGWSRNWDYPAFFTDQTCYACYRRDRGDDRPTFNLYLLRTDPQTLSVVSIVPNTGTLSLPEHRAVLHDFRFSVLDMFETRHFPVVVVEPAVPPAREFAPPPEVLKVLERWTPLVNNGA